MKKILKSAMLATVVSALVISSQAIAAPSSTLDNNLIQSTNQVLTESSALSQEDRLKELEKLGWEVQTTSEKGTISPMSAPGEGKITNYFMKNPDKPGTYLVEAIWEYTDTQQSWDATSASAYDVLGIAVTDEYGKAVNAQGTNGGIVVEDVDYNHTDGGSVYSYQNSGATFTIADSYLYGIGMNGYAWFYISKPTSGKSYYMNSQWIHTWNTLSATLTKVTLSYPFNVSASFSRTPSQWATSDQDSIVFN